MKSVELGAERLSLHSVVLQRAKALADGIIAEQAAEIDLHGSWPQAGIQALLAAGLGGLVVAPEHRGWDTALSRLRSFVS
jgi:alkylation response protein AidB-like acyl-CoA dehydrogenase